MCVCVPSLYIFMYMYIQSPYTWKGRSGKTKVSWSYFFLNKKIQTLTMQVENVLREKRKALREREEAEIKSLEVSVSIFVYEVCRCMRRRTHACHVRCLSLSLCLRCVVI